jgi:hypothetical protein
VKVVLCPVPKSQGVVGASLALPQCTEPECRAQGPGWGGQAVGALCLPRIYNCYL